MVPSGPHAAPDMSRTLQTSCGAPPEAATFFNFPALRYPMERLSGDQNGWVALSVPASLTEVTDRTGRT